MPAARRRLVAFLELALIGGGLLLTWSQPWLTARIEGQPVELGGDRVASGLVAIALTVFAVIAALAIAGPILRAVLGVLTALVGVSGAVVGIRGLMNPGSALEALVAERTGLSGEEAVAALTSDVAATVWGPIAVGFAAILVVVGIQLAITAPRWSTQGRRNGRTRFEPSDSPSGGSSPVDDWDALSAGTDPTGPTGDTPGEESGGSESSR